MSFLVLAYPKLSDRDFKWIQNIRKEYDKRYYNVVNPHFTIVFPVMEIQEEDFIDHVISISSSTKKIKFTSGCAVIVKDSFSEYSDIFLVPDEGLSKIVKLHNDLYSGILAKDLRLDIPFIPHIGIGGDADPVKCKKIIDNINNIGFCIEGELDKLDIIYYSYPKVETLKQIKLL